MTVNKTLTNFTVDRENQTLIIERVFNAPRQLVWQAWTEPDRVARWWAPSGLTTVIHEMDPRPGGLWHYSLQGPKGMVSNAKTYYREVVEPERLVYLDTFVDEEGNLVEGLPELNITTEFTETNGKTRVISRTRFNSIQELEFILKMGVEKGVTEAWNQLEELLAAA